VKDAAQQGSGDLEKRNIELVRKLYSLAGRGKWAEAEQYLADDFVIVEADTLPFKGTYSGKGALRELFAIVVATAGIQGVKEEQMTAGGDRVVALRELLLQGSPPGRCRLAEVFQIRDGKVTEILPFYFDSSAIVRSAEAVRVAAKA
jgi:ketosteroid isomerase-like protein